VGGRAMARRKRQRPGRQGQQLQAAARNQSGATQPVGAARGPDQFMSPVADGLLKFADALRDNAAEAMNFQEAEVIKRLGGQATRNAETRFVNRARELERELHQRVNEFGALEAGCPSEDQCRPIIDCLVSNAIVVHLQRLADAVSDIARHAASPLSDEHREQLSHSLQALNRIGVTLVELADWITAEVGALRGTPVPWRQSSLGGELPPVVAALLQECEMEGRAFVQVLADRPLSCNRRTDDTTLTWLAQLKQEKTRLLKACDAFTAGLGKFNDEHLQAAQAAGPQRLVQFLEERERVLNQLRARRGFSLNLTDLAIEDCTRRLSLQEADMDAADAIQRMLGSVAVRLEEQRQLLNTLASRAANDRTGANVTEAELPSWEEIYGEGEQRGGADKGLWMLVMAFQDSDADGQEFTAADRRTLATRLSRRFGGTPDDYLNSWLDRRLKRAEKLKIVFLHPPAKSRRVGHTFELYPAAISRYRGEFPAR
jgi:hypothetical protein